MNKNWKNLPFKERAKHWYACNPFEQSALALALTGLGTAFSLFIEAIMLQFNDNPHGLHLIPKFILVIVSVILWINVFIRQLTDFKRTSMESKGVATASMIPTWFMTLMNFGNAVATIAIFDKSFNGVETLNREAIMICASILIYIGLAMDAIWFIYIIVLYFYVEKLKPEKDSLAPWLVPFVGIGIFAIDAIGFDVKYIPFILVNIVWWFAVANLVWLYPVLIYRHIKFPVHDHQQNTIAVFGAAPCLILMGFINGLVIGPNGSNGWNLGNSINRLIDTYNGDWIITTVFVIQIPIAIALYIFLIIWFFKNGIKAQNYGTVGYTFPIAVNAGSILGIASLFIKSNGKNYAYFNKLNNELGMTFTIYGGFVLITAIIFISTIIYFFIKYFIKDYNARKPFVEQLDDINF